MDQERLSDVAVEQVRHELRVELREWLEHHEKADVERFEQLVAGQARIQRAVDEMNGKVGRMNAEIGYGLPEPGERGDRATLRERLHGLENEEVVAKAIHDSYARTLGRWQKVGLFGFAALAAVEGFLRLIGVGG